MELLTSVLEDLYGRIQKPTEAEETRTAEILNDSSLSNISFDSCFDTTISERADSALRPCQQAQKDYSNGSVKNRFTFQKSKNSDDSNNFPIPTAKSDRGVDGLENKSRSTELQFGNRLALHHSGNRENNDSIATSDKKTDPISMMDCMQSNDITDAGRSEERDDSCNVKEPGNTTDNGYGDFLTKGSFDIIDDDLEDLLDTQNAKVCDSDRCKAMNTTDAMLDATDIMLAGDIGAIGEEDDDKTNKVCSIDSHMVEERNEACGDGIMTKILDWSKGIAEKQQCDGEVIQPVQLLAGGSHVTRKRPLSPNQDVEALAATPPTKRKSSECLVMISLCCKCSYGNS